jgi:hypothetical protein
MLSQCGMACAIRRQIDFRRNIINAERYFDIAAEYFPRPLFHARLDDCGTDPDAFVVCQVLRDRLADSTAPNYSDSLHCISAPHLKGLFVDLACGSSVVDCEQLIVPQY